MNQSAAISVGSQPASISKYAMDTSCFSKYSDYVASEVRQLKEFPNLRELSQQTYYGGAPKHLWTKLRQPEDDPIGRQEEKSSNEDQWQSDATNTINRSITT